FFLPSISFFIYTLSLHDALPICSFRDHILQFLFCLGFIAQEINPCASRNGLAVFGSDLFQLPALRFVDGLKFLETLVAGNDEQRSEEHTLNSSHVSISYAVFCLK